MTQIQLALILPERGPWAGRLAAAKHQRMTKETAYHEAGHAVVARVLGIMMAM
jgi:hypothetical protein